MGMEERTGFDMKNSLTLPSLSINYFNNLRDENDEDIYSLYWSFYEKFCKTQHKSRQMYCF